MINEFVDKIIVHEPDRSTGKRTQQIDIYLTFIGKFDIPMPEPTAEELEAERLLDEKRAKKREYNRRYQEKKRGKPIMPRLGEPVHEQTVKEFSDVQDGNCA